MYVLIMLAGILLGYGTAFLVQYQKKPRRYGFPSIPTRKNYADTQYLNGKKDRSAEDF